MILTKVYFFTVRKNVKFLASCSQLARNITAKTIKISPAVSELFLLAAKSSKRFISSARYFSYLASNLIATKSIPGHLMESLSEEISANFQQEFVIEFEENERLPFEDSVLKYSLDEEAMVAFNMSGQRENIVPLLGISDQFNLMQKLELEINDNLDNIDAVLGCPFILPSACQSNLDFIVLFCTSNLMRTIINSFCDQQDSSIQEKIRKRLDHVKELEEKMEKYLRNSKKVIVITPSALGKVQDIVIRLQATSEVLSKSRHHSQDKKSASLCSDVNEISIKYDSLHNIKIKFDRNVLNWLKLGIANEDGKDKRNDQLLQSEFLVLAVELVYQLANGSNDDDDLLSSVIQQLEEFLETSKEAAEIEKFVELCIRFLPSNTLASVQIYS